VSPELKDAIETIRRELPVVRRIKPMVAIQLDSMLNTFVIVMEKEGL
jgi:hypothetical protein